MKIFIIILNLLIFASFILVGSPISYNCLTLNLIIIITGTIYLIYKILKKQNVIKNKIDIILLIFCLSPTIPLIFNTYNSLTETLSSIIKYISIFNIYIILKDIIISEKNKNVIINVLIISGVILTILGIDELAGKNIINYLYILDLPKVEGYGRMFSTLGYENAFSIIVGVDTLLVIEKLKDKKNIYSGALIILIGAVFLSYSRIVLIIWLSILFIYFILNRKNIYLISIFITDFILALIYAKVFDTFLTSERYIEIWIITIVFALLGCFIEKIIRKNYQKLYKLKKKNLIIISIVGLIIVLLIYFIGKELIVPLEIYKYREGNDETRYDIFDVEANTEYNFEFDISAKTKLENIENYSIEILERNKYYDTIETHKITFNNYEGKKTIEFVTDSETKAIAILINSNFQMLQDGLTIKSLYINGELYPLNYLYLPTKLVDRIESISFSNKSCWERFVFYKDALEIIKENWLFGTGGKGWEYNYLEIQSYSYATTEVHSYLFQIFIENGIISVIMYIIIILLTIKNIIKRRMFTGYELAFVLLVAHSSLDFDMSFYCVMMMWIILLTVISKKENEEIVKRKGKVDIIILLLLNFVVIGLGVNLYIQKDNNEKLLIEMRNSDGNEKIELIRNYNEKETLQSMYIELLYTNFSDVTEENLEYLYDYIINQKIVVDTQINLYRNRLIMQICESSNNENIIYKFAQIIIDENEEMVSNIKNKDQNRLTEEKIEKYLKEQKMIYQIAIDKLNEQYIEN